MRRLTVRGRYLAWEDGEPFFYLADTAWELPHRLSREETAKYFTVRARQGFTAVQCVALAEFDGLTAPNYYGRLPLELTDGTPDPSKPDLSGEYSYWAHLDYVVETAAANGIFVTLLPTWGDKFNKLWGVGPEIFTVENARRYGSFISSRYARSENIIWMLGGDRPLKPSHRAVIDAMAEGIRSADTSHLITFHPPGGGDSTDYLADAEWLDFHTAQTGHDTGQCLRSDEIIAKMRGASDKPCLDSEPRYEDHPACFNDKIGYYWNADDVRQNAYWDVLSGACGHTYGNHCIWSCTREPSAYFPYKWDDALTHDGAEQIANVKKLRLSRDYFSLRPAPELTAESSLRGMGHMTAALGNDYAYFYSPLGVPFTSRLDLFGGGVKALRAIWFDTRTGEETVFCILPSWGENTFVPPSQGKGRDWILILEAVR